MCGVSNVRVCDDASERTASTRPHTAPTCASGLMCCVASNSWFAAVAKISSSLFSVPGSASSSCRQERAGRTVSGRPERTAAKRVPAASGAQNHAPPTSPRTLPLAAPPVALAAAGRARSRAARTSASRAQLLPRLSASRCAMLNTVRKQCTFLMPKPEAGVVPAAAPAAAAGAAAAPPPAADSKPPASSSIRPEAALTRAAPWAVAIACVCVCVC
jgi:hypothetical protein